MSSHPYTENGSRGALAWGETNRLAIKAMDSTVILSVFHRKNHTY